MPRPGPSFAIQDASRRISALRAQDEFLAGEVDIPVSVPREDPIRELDNVVVGSGGHRSLDVREVPGAVRPDDEGRATSTRCAEQNELQQDTRDPLVHRQCLLS